MAFHISQWRPGCFVQHRTSCLCFLCLDFSGSVGKVERGYSDAGFRDRRAILFFGFHSKIPLAVQRHNGFSITASTLRGHTGFLALSLCFFFTAEAYLKLCVCGRMLSFVCEPRLLVYSPIHIVTAFGRVIPHFPVAKLVCSRVRLKALVNGVASQIFLYRAGGFDGLR